MLVDIKKKLRTLLTYPLMILSMILIIIAGGFSIILGPQTCHNFNIIGLSITAGIVIINIFAIKSAANIFKNHKVKILGMILLIVLNFGIGISLIKIRYGYTNWEYINPIKMEYVKPE